MALNIKFFEGLEKIKEIISVGYIPVDTKARKDSKRLASSEAVAEVEESLRTGSHQFVLERADMTTAFSDSEYQDCVDAVEDGIAVCVQFTETGTTIQSQLTQLTGSGDLVFEFNAGAYRYRYEVDAAEGAHTITRTIFNPATVYTPKGPASVATLNTLSGQENGWLYTMTDAGTLTDGSLAVVAGDTVAWDEANSVWYKAMDYAPSQYGTNEVHNLPTSITAFRTGDVIPVDGPSGTAKMSKDDLLNEALAGNLAPAFVDTQGYKKYDYVVYNGKYYRFKTDRAAGAWNSSHVVAVDEDDLVLKVKAIPSTDVNDYNEVGIYEVSGTYTNMPAGEGGNNGMLVVFIARTSRKLQLLQFSESNTNSKSRIYFRSGEYGSNTWAKWAKLQDMSEALDEAPIFDATRTISDPYKVNDWVIYNNTLYKFTAEHYGAWNSSHATEITLSENVFRLKAQPSTDLNDYNSTGIYDVDGTFSNYPSGETRNGSLTVFFARGSRKFQVLQVGVNTASSPSVLYFRVGENGTNTYGKWEQIINSDNLADMCRNTERIMVLRNLTANTDLNDCTACGYYSLSTSYTFTNTPSGWTYGFVVVYSLLGRLLQVAYNQGTGDVWQRSYASGAWGSWQRINGSDENCSIKYDSANTWTITFGDFKVNLIHAINANKQMDTYNLSKITDKAGNVICPQGTDIIGPAKIDGEVDFIGGVHGYETATSVNVVCDGVVQTLDSSLDTAANEINIFIETSDISHVSLSEVWTREIAITIKKNEILVSSKYTITSATDLTIFRMTNGGLMAAYHDDLGSAWMPNKILSPIPTTSISNASEKNIVCEFNTKYGTIRVENIVGHELATYKGWWQNFHNETPKRLKSYFDLINGNTIVHNGEVFVGVAKYTMIPKV